MSSRPGPLRSRPGELAHAPANGKRGCNGKRSYTGFALASAMAKRTRQQSDAPVEAYHCRHCNRFHVGEARIKRRPE